MIYSATPGLLLVCLLALTTASHPAAAQNLKPVKVHDVADCPTGLRTADVSAWPERGSELIAAATDRKAIAFSPGVRTLFSSAAFDTDIAVLKAYGSIVDFRYVRWTSVIFANGSGRSMLAGTDQLTGEKQDIFGGHTVRLSAVARSTLAIVAPNAPDTLVATNSTGAMAERPKEHTGAITVLVASPDGTLLFTGGEDGKVCGFSVTDTPGDFRTNAHEGAVTAIAVSHDSRLVITAGADNRLRVWMRPVHQKDDIKCKAAVTALAFCPASDGFLAGDAEGNVLYFRAGDRWTQPSASVEPGLGRRAARGGCRGERRLVVGSDRRCHRPRHRDWRQEGAQRGVVLVRGERPRRPVRLARPRDRQTAVRPGKLPTRR